MSQSNTGYDVWGVVASVLSLLVYIPSFFRNLPIRKARVFEDTLADTRCVLYGYIEDGCLDDVFILKATLQLSTCVSSSHRIPVLAHRHIQRTCRCSAHYRYL